VYNGGRRWSAEAEGGRGFLIAARGRFAGPGRGGRLRRWRPRFVFVLSLSRKNPAPAGQGDWASVVWSGVRVSSAAGGRAKASGVLDGRFFLCLTAGLTWAFGNLPGPTVPDRGRWSYGPRLVPKCLPPRPGRFAGRGEGPLGGTWGGAGALGEPASGDWLGSVLSDRQRQPREGWGPSARPPGLLAATAGGCLEAVRRGPASPKGPDLPGWLTRRAVSGWRQPSTTASTRRVACGAADCSAYFSSSTAMFLYLQMVLH